MLKTLKTAGTMYISSTLSYKNALRIKHRDDERVYSSPSKLCIRKVASVSVAKNIPPQNAHTWIFFFLVLKRKLGILDLLKQQFPYLILSPFSL